DWLYLWPCLGVALNRLISLSLLLLACAGAHAKDYGVQGQIWAIAERDMREVVLEQASRVDWSAKNQELEESARTYLDRLPKRFLPVAQKTTTVWTDPSVQTTEDVLAPVKQPDGSFAWQVII